MTFGAMAAPASDSIRPPQFGGLFRFTCCDHYIAVAHYNLCRVHESSKPDRQCQDPCPAWLKNGGLVRVCERPISASTRFWVLACFDPWWPDLNYDEFRLRQINALTFARAYCVNMENQDRPKCSGFCSKEADHCMLLAGLSQSPLQQKIFIRMAAHWAGVAQECGGEFHSWFAWCQPENVEASPKPWSPFVAHFINSYLEADSDPKDAAKAYKQATPAKGK